MCLSQSEKILILPVEKTGLQKEKTISGISREWRVKLETGPGTTWQERCQSLFVTWWEPCLGVGNNSDACDASSEKKIFGIAVGKRSESERITTAESAVMAHSNLSAAWKCFYKGLCPFHLIVKWGRRKAKQPLPDHSLAHPGINQRPQSRSRRHARKARGRIDREPPLCDRPGLVLLLDFAAFTHTYAHQRQPRFQIWAKTQKWQPKCLRACECRLNVEDVKRDI